MSRTTTAAILAVVTAACGSPSAPTPPAAVWPTHGWATATPDAEGFDMAALAALDQEFAAGTHGQVTGMLITRHGRVVIDKTYTHDFDALFAGHGPERGPYNYYDPDWHPYYQHGPLHTMQSVSKSVTSTLVGIAIARGEIPGVDAKLLPYFTGFRHDADPRRDTWTLAHVLTMTTGIRWDESTVAYTDPANSCANMEHSPDWVQYVLDQPLAADPGTTFNYNSGATELLAHVLKTATGKHAHEYAAERLFAPLGITDTYWKQTPTGLSDTEGGLYLTPRDLAKIGYLYLRDGMWEGTRLLPEGWVAKATSPLVDTRPGQPRSRRYGYKWWVLPHADGSAYAYAALGYGGQRLIVVPEQDIVAVFTGWNIYEHAELAPYTALDRLLGTVAR